MRREPVFEDGPALDEDELHAIGPARPSGRGRLVFRLACAAALIAGISVIAHDRSAAPPRPQTLRPIVAPDLRAQAAGPLLALDPSADGAEASFRAEAPVWSAATGLREDGLSQGGFEAIDAPYLRLVVAEAGRDAGAPPSLFVSLARRAAEVRGLAVIRTGLRGQVETKFGPFETVEATLSAQGANQGARRCTGFQSATARLRIDGWLCGLLGQAPEPRALACALDRLRLAGATAPTVEMAFGEAELRRGTGCAVRDPGESRADATGSVAPRGATASGRSRKVEREKPRSAQAWR